MASYPTIDSELLRTFVAIADQGGYTRAAEQVNRTQSAVSMQMKRLEEDVVQRSLFQRNGRQMLLTAEGELLLGYARRILRLQGEALNSLRAPHMVGLVRIGTPDDYVTRFLPGVLARFAQAFPLVQVEMHCEPSFQLLQRQDLDLTIVTREPGKEIGQLLRQEEVVWAQAENAMLHERSTLPLAMFNADCFCRNWACNALDTLNRDYRVAYSSPSLSAILAVVGAGLAITAQLRSLIPADMRIIGKEEGLPDMPMASIVLLRNPRSQSPVTECLAEHIAEGFRQH
ncbi:LysR substrate-binding domain-containing protein [Halopseudomonas aestusnigri]|jgi:DNA-binding transcriptional LysR family regulator|uniref:LysR substrate-binding domain-containing protein n=1 Tax=Halopseudomonas TaxID=2901189 RepID=UPI000C8E200E|nr:MULTISPECIES: LysR substrate-binding domain-containing protein [Halopseudomonas]MAH00795.1 LysR family transcriptional regulator [Pseudomonadales bacterium]HBM14336.1 LysR family transcriptional regulator [Rhodospirillaceae bacterium]HBT58229.1 LysR family transcriptional regulator [Pseudomonas sp.]MAP75592.1 LysR family transcriptional regulator [Pseudomonadales bacterium]MCC4262360.1 LysR family transcriptional regulator [Halopseudomonas aestusnigri]|tara:strand:- start:4047 stop:4904 length:858 start_codon:yes stop_codon:yes gene_type:complete